MMKREIDKTMVKKVFFSIYCDFSLLCLWHLSQNNSTFSIFIPDPLFLPTQRIEKEQLPKSVPTDGQTDGLTHTLIHMVGHIWNGR